MRIPHLDGLRGIAILLILLRHFGYHYPATTVWDQIIHTTFLAMWCGVDLFFVLSGFLITGILIDTRQSSNYFTSFWARRFLRIVPVYIVFLTTWFYVIPVVARLFGIETNFDQYSQIPYWTWTANIANHYPSPTNNPHLLHLWSLSVGAQFYLLWPVLVFALSNRSLVMVCAALVIICPGVRMLLMVNPPSPQWPFIIFARFDSLALGALVAIIMRDPWWKAVAIKWWKAVLAIGVLGTAAVVLWIGTVDFEDGESRPPSAIGFSFIDISFAALLAGILTVRASSLLDWRWLRLLGKYSYGIYLFHGPIPHVVMYRLSNQWWIHTRFGAVVFIISGCVASFLIAFVSWHVIEERFLLLKKYFSVRLKDSSMK